MMFSSFYSDILFINIIIFLQIEAIDIRIKTLDIRALKSTAVQK